MPTPANISLDPVTLPIHRLIAWSRYLSIPREEVAKMPEDLQKLIGYNGDFGIMGKVDGMSPLDLANGVRSATSLRARRRTLGHTGCGRCHIKRRARTGSQSDSGRWIWSMTSGRGMTRV